MDRRSFLTHTSTAALGSAIIPPFSLSSMAPLQKKSLKWGMIQMEGSILDKFKLLADIGFDGVELNSPDELDDQEVLKAIEATGVVVPGLVNSVHWKQTLSDPDPSIRQICIDATIEALHRCKELGGDTVLLVPGVVGKDVSYEDAWNRSQVEIRKLIPDMEKTGVRIALENVWNNFLISPVEARQYVDAINHPLVGWYMDVGNVVRYGWPEHWIETLGDRIFKIDIKEYSRQKQRDEGVWKGFQVEIGEGDCDWKRVNQALLKAGYSGWGSAEVRGGDETRLRDIYQRMETIYAL